MLVDVVVKIVLNSNVFHTNSPLEKYSASIIPQYLQNAIAQQTNCYQLFDEIAQPIGVFGQFVYKKVAIGAKLVQHLMSVAIIALQSQWLQKKSQQSAICRDFDVIV